MLIQKGTLKVGDWLVVGTHYCKVKYIKDDRSSKLPSAYPGQAVEVVGFKQLPSSG
jgi:translation initiation factor IF-2